MHDKKSASFVTSGKLSSEFFHVHYYKEIIRILSFNLEFICTRGFLESSNLFALRAHAILILSEKLTRANKFQIERKNTSDK